MRVSRGSWPTPDEVADLMAEVLPPSPTPPATRAVYDAGAKIDADPALAVADPLDNPEAFLEAWGKAGAHTRAAAARLPAPG